MTTVRGTGTHGIAMFRPHVSERAIARVVEVLRSGWIGEGPVVAQFEDAFRTRTGAAHAVAVNSGTSALHLAITLAGVGPGDEVITTAQTMMATSHAILMQHARPVFADVKYFTGNVDPVDIGHRITPRTKCFLVVHWAGYPCDMDEIHAVAAAHGLPVIEDAAHAVGAVYKGRSIGSLSDYTCFSFQAIKHITTGDGGMLAIRSADKWDEARRRRWFGIDRTNRKPSVLGEPEWNVTEPGYKYHMNDIAASLGIEHLEELPRILERRAAIAARYRQALARVPGVTLFESAADRTSAHWLFSIHVERRTDFARMMQSKGMAASVVHLRIDTNDVFGGLRQDLPVLARFTESHISVPVHEFLTDDDVDRVIRAVQDGW